MNDFEPNDKERTDRASTPTEESHPPEPADPIEIPCPRGHGPVRVDGVCMVCGHDIAIGGER